MLAGLIVCNTSHQCGELDIVRHRQVANQVKELEDDPDLTTAQQCTTGLSHVTGNAAFAKADVELSV